MLPRVIIGNKTSAKRYGVASGQFALISEDEKRGIGNNFQFTILWVRPKAVEVAEHYSTDAPVRASHDPKSTLFKSIALQAEDRDTKCLAGTELVIYIHKHGLASYFICTQGTRAALNGLQGQLQTKLDGRHLGGEVIVASVTSIQGHFAAGSFYTPKFTVTDFAWPHQSRFETEVQTYLNPPKPKTPLTERELFLVGMMCEFDEQAQMTHQRYSSPRGVIVAKVCDRVQRDTGVIISEVQRASIQEHWEYPHP